MRHRITVRLDESLRMQAKAIAVEQNKSLNSLIEEGLRAVLDNSEKPETYGEMSTAESG